jgi:hypothetical protein
MRYLAFVAFVAAAQTKFVFLNISRLADPDLTRLYHNRRLTHGCGGPATHPHHRLVATSRSRLLTNRYGGSPRLPDAPAPFMSSCALALPFAVRAAVVDATATAPAGMSRSSALLDRQSDVCGGRAAFSMARVRIAEGAPTRLLVANCIDFNRTNAMWHDNETERDFLNFSGVADTVAEIVVQARGPPTSIGVSGSWGIGKSSMIKLIRASVAGRARKGGDREFVFVEFNAWLYQGYDDARAALMDVSHEIFARLNWRCR